jgi:ArsR family transcriptional regulator
MAISIPRGPGPKGFGRYANLLTTLGHPTRLCVLEVLSRGPLHVNRIHSEVSVERTLLSHHLRTLCKTGLVTARREGKSVLYQLAPSIDRPLKTHCIESICCKVHLERSRKPLAPCDCRSFPLMVAICLLSRSAQIGDDLRDAKRESESALANAY